MDNQNYQIKRFLMQKSAKNNVPVSGTFELTPLCNFNCKMCYIRMSREEMEKRGRLRTAKEWIELGRECADAGMLFLLLTGGEPFLREDFFEIYGELKKLGLIITINTNGYMIDEKTAEKLIENPPSKVNITLYGASNRTYKELCECENGFDRVIKAIKTLKESGILVNVNYSITPYNAKDMEKIFSICKKLNVPVNPTAYMFPPVRNNKNGVIEYNTRLKANEAGCMRYMAEKFKYSSEEFEYRKAAIKAGMEVQNGLEECDARTVNEKMGCMAGRASFWVTWDGRMTPCGMLNTPCVELGKFKFLTKWKEINKKINEIYLPKECSNCDKRKVCGVCAALTISETGSFDKRPDYLCQMTEEYVKKVNNE